MLLCCSGSNKHLQSDTWPQWGSRAPLWQWLRSTCWNLPAACLFLPQCWGQALNVPWIFLWSSPGRGQWDMWQGPLTEAPGSHLQEWTRSDWQAGGAAPLAHWGLHALHVLIPSLFYWWKGWAIPVPSPRDETWHSYSTSEIKATNNPLPKSSTLAWNFSILKYTINYDVTEKKNQKQAKPIT